MNTRELIASLPEYIREATEAYREAWKRARAEGKMGAYETIRAEWYGYTKALRDAGAITEHQRKVLYIYGTV